MKVINEASAEDVRAAEERFNNAKSDSEKAAEVYYLLMQDDNLKNSDGLKALQKFPDSFIVRWANAMKFDEIGRDNNEFINLIKRYKDGEIIFSSLENFYKIYNAYADDLIDNKYLNSELFNELIHHYRLYNLNQEDFNSVLKIYSDLKQANNNDNDIKTVFFEDNGDLRTIADIKARSGGDKKDRLLDLIKDKENITPEEYKKFSNLFQDLLKSGEISIKG